MAERAINLHPSWREPLLAEFDQPYMQALKGFLAAERAAGTRLDGAKRLTGLIGALGEHIVGGARLNDHHRQGVRHDVVHLARDPCALLHHGPARLRPRPCLLGSAPLSRGPCQDHRQQIDRQTRGAARPEGRRRRQAHRRQRPHRHPPRSGGRQHAQRDLRREQRPRQGHRGQQRPHHEPRRRVHGQYADRGAHLPSQGTDLPEDQGHGHGQSPTALRTGGQHRGAEDGEHQAGGPPPQRPGRPGRELAPGFPGEGLVRLSAAAVHAPTLSGVTGPAVQESTPTCRPPGPACRAGRRG